MTSGAIDRISKVTVEFYDPSGVFPVLSRHLQSHLPLRNLHWKSQNRPLRSIDFLHVDLVPGKDAPSKSQESRHQIPGLRQTPYLKLFLLRCDDVDAYRENGRKSLREWLKANNLPSSSSSNAQENHDAYEWMILHVVFPNTAAANQPRYSKSSSKDEEPSGKTGSKLLGRSSNTILEKIKADFNVSSKSAPDRVAQVRLQPDDVPKDQLPAKKVGEPGHVETPQERQNAWNDVVAKLKLLILSSFDLRVRQYEEDIKERGSQRSLPGWNFCTFFVLKEGLSMGLESVGLLDDALLGYDELSAELDSVMRDESNAMNAFLETTPELKDLLTTAYKSDSEVTPVWTSTDKPIDPRRKEYRALILSNNISVFDFKSYIFSRQIILLRRMGILHASEVAKIKSDKPSASQDSEDLNCLAQLCQRAASFVTSVSRVLRAELRHAAEANSLEHAENTIEEIALSWTYAVAAQMLEETATDSLTAALKQMNKLAQAPSSPSNQKLPPPKRTSSLAVSGTLSAPYEQVPEDAQVIFDSLRHGKPTSPTAAAGASGYEFEELAARRADLILLQRRTLEKLGQRRDWFVGIPALPRGIAAANDGMIDVDLDRSDGETSSDNADGEEKKASVLGPGICHEGLRDAFHSKEDFTRSYESLTSTALNHYFAATRPKAIEELFADLAIISFEKGDMVGAASYFSRVTPLYAERQWLLIEDSLLRLHAQCLKTLHRRDDYIQILLRLLEKAVNRQRSLTALKLDSTSVAPISLHDSTLKFGELGLIEELEEASKDLPYEVTVPMFTLFDKVAIDPHIQHFDYQDGFCMRIKFRHLLAEPVGFDTARLRLSSTEDAQRQDVVLEGREIDVKQGVCSVEVRTNVTTRGLFQAEQFSLQAGNLAFMIKSTSESETTQQIRLEKRQVLSEQQLPQILCYLSNESFYASVKASQDVHLDKPPRLELRIESGRNEIHAAEIRIRSASAGLRLQTADAKFKYPVHDAQLEKATAPGVVHLKNVSQHSTLDLFIPYDLEREAPTITIRLEVSYQTSVGDFVYASVKTIPVALPVDVNVRDFFKSAFIRSTFNIKPAGASPLNILDIELSDTDQFQVKSASIDTAAILVFPDQSAQKSYRIRRRVDDSIPRSPTKKEAPLNLSIWYQCLDEQVISSIRSSLDNGLEGSDFANFSRLLTTYLEGQVRRWLNSNRLSSIGILGEIACPSFRELGWKSLLPRLPRSQRERLQAWLEDWHEQNQVLPLDLADSLNTDKEIDGVRRLDITVPVPRLPVLHTAKLSLPKKPSQIFTTGSLINAELNIVHTRRWDSPNVFESLSQSPDGPLDFAFELDAPPETWLIAGQRRTRFSAKENEALTWDILLMPLKAGRIFLPSVQVRLVGTGTEELGCDTFYESMGETVVVINDVGSTTVAVQDTPMGTEPALLGVEGRI